MTDTTTTNADPATTDGNEPFRWRLANRPDVRFGHAAGGAAGILAAAAVVAFVVDVTDDNPRWPGVGFNLLLIAVAVAAGVWIRGPVRSAGVAAIAVAIPQVWFFAVVGDSDDIGRGDFRLILGLSIAAYAVFYLLTWTRGRAILLGLALLFAANWLVFEVASQDVPFVVDVAGQAQSGGADDPSRVLGADDDVTETGIADLGVAVVLLGAGVVLDRRRKAGAATPCLLVGGLYAVNAAITLGVDVDDVYAAGAFVVLAGLAIGLAGSLGRRRGTSWIGAAVLLGGVVAVVVQATDDVTRGDNGTLRFGELALAGAAALLLAGVVVARTFGEPVDGGEPDDRGRPEQGPEPGPEPVGAAPAPTAAAAPEAPAPAAPPASPAPVSWAAPSPDASPAAAGEPDDEPPDAPSARVEL